MRQFIFFFILALLFFNCEKKTDWPLKGPQRDLIVVDGIIVDEKKSQSIRITRSVDELNGKPIPVTGANVIIYDDDSTCILTEFPEGSGNYSTPGNFIASTGKKYTLLINYNNRIYSAKTYMVPGYQFRQLDYVKNSNDDKYHIDWVAYPYNTERPAMWVITIDWSHVSGYISNDSTSNRAILRYYALSTLDVNELFAPAAERISFPKGAIITETRYSLTSEHVAFLRAMLSETSWNGGLFDSSPANVPTNLSEGAVGFFGACSITTISMTVN